MAKDKMKAWYDDIDAKSKNLMMQTMYEYREKEIQDFKETNHELAETCIARKKRIDELEKENSELKEKLNFSTQYYRGEKAREQLTKAKEIILKLYNAGRDVLMCRAEEKAYDNLSEAISDRSIEQFLSEVGHD